VNQIVSHWLIPLIFDRILGRLLRRRSLLALVDLEDAGFVRGKSNLVLLQNGLLKRVMGMIGRFEGVLGIVLRLVGGVTFVGFALIFLERWLGGLNDLVVLRKLTIDFGGGTRILGFGMRGRVIERGNGMLDLRKVGQEVRMLDFGRGRNGLGM
jgi:hypothetical protein